MQNSRVVHAMTDTVPQAREYSRHAYRVLYYKDLVSFKDDDRGGGPVEDWWCFRQYNKAARGIL